MPRNDSGASQPPLDQAQWEWPLSKPKSESHWDGSAVLDLGQIGHRSPERTA
jgi:hypothetical protein